MSTASSIALPAGVKSEFLEGIPPSDLRVILGAARQRRCAVRHVLIHAGEPATHVYLLTSGRARSYIVTEEGQRLIVKWYEPGELLGAASLLSKPTHYRADTEIMEEGNALVWDRAAIRGLAHKYPTLLDNALTIAAEYVTRYMSIHLSLVSHSAEQRLAQALAELGQSAGRSVARGVELDVTNEQLADMAHVSQFTASRLLSNWQRCGAISKSRGRIVIRSAEQLAVRH